MKSSRRQNIALLVVLVAFGLVFATGCLSPIDYWYASEKQDQQRNARLEQARARLPYIGTGTVIAVSGGRPGVVDTAAVDFAPDPPPPWLAHFLVVRSNAVVGKLRQLSASHNDPVPMEVLEGIPRAGDLVIGSQHEKEFKNQRPKERQ